MIWRAHAKLNLCLSVGAPEPEGAAKAGWHTIASWMQCIDLHDEVHLCALPEGQPASVSVRWADDAPRPTTIDWPIEKDLAHRALRSLEEHAGRPLPVAVEVVKRVPVGGGLGGGSADAAAVLLGVPRLLGLSIDHADLLRLGLSLGSDVGFFMDPDAQEQTPPRGALIGGFGDEVRRVEGASSEVLLIVPGYGCPTPPVYKAFDQVLAERQREDSIERAHRKLVGPAKQWGAKMSLVESRWERAVETGKVEGDRLFNDLAVPAFRVEPRLGQLVTALARATRETPCVTGSGSCIFFPATTGKIDKLRERVERLIEAVQGEEFGSGAKTLHTRLI